MWSTSTTAHKWMLHSMVWFLSWCRHRRHTTVADHTTGIMTSVLPCPATAPSHTWVTGIWRCIWTLTSNLTLTLSKPCLITVAIIPVINIHGDVCIYIYICVCVCVLKYLGVIQVNCLVVFESERALRMTHVYVSLHWLLLCAVIGWNSCSFRTCMS